MPTQPNGRTVSVSQPVSGSLSDPVSVSVAVPLFNEEGVVESLVRRLTAVLDSLPGDGHEIVLVDDGSTDRTVEVLEGLATEDPHLVILQLSRNFGHQAAMSAALAQTTEGTKGRPHYVIQAKTDSRVRGRVDS